MGGQQDHRLPPLLYCTPKMKLSKMKLQSSPMTCRAGYAARHLCPAPDGASGPSACHRLLLHAPGVSSGAAAAAVSPTLLSQPAWSAAAAAADGGLPVLCCVICPCRTGQAGCGQACGTHRPRAGAQGAAGGCGGAAHRGGCGLAANTHARTAAPAMSAGHGWELGVQLAVGRQQRTRRGGVGGWSVGGSWRTESMDRWAAAEEQCASVDVGYRREPS